MTKTPHEYVRVTYEYIRVHTRVTYEYIRVTFKYIRVTYDLIRSNMVVYRLYTNTLDCIRKHRSNIRFPEGNRHEMYHFSHFLFTCAEIMSCCTRERAKCHMHEYHTRINLVHARATLAQTNLSAYVIRCNVLVEKKNAY